MIGCIIKVGDGILMSLREALTSYLCAEVNAHDGPADGVAVSVEVVVVDSALHPEDDTQVVV